MQFSDKTELITIFQDTLERCQNDVTLSSDVENSLNGQYVLKDGEEVDLDEVLYDKPADITVSMRRTIEAAEYYKDSKVCVLNFASSKNPGGGVANGARAQEECICRVTTLYPCLSSESIMNEFYLPHRSMFSDTLYNDDLIFTPKVFCIKTDTTRPVIRDRKEWFTVDVITCASPNLSAYTRIGDEQLEKIQQKRLERVFLTAIKEGAETLILGAFGCGAFRNPPEVVARVMKALCDKYSHYFKTIEFAVYCTKKNPRNYEVFCDVFGVEPNCVLK